MNLLQICMRNSEHLWPTVVRRLCVGHLYWGFSFWKSFRSRMVGFEIQSTLAGCIGDNTEQVQRVFRTELAKGPKDQRAEEGETFIVEKIIDKRFVQGEVQYLAKWIGYPNNFNTWDPERILNCPRLIEDYNKSQRGTVEKTVTKEQLQNERVSGFHKGKAVDVVLGFTKVDGEIFYLIKWKGPYDTDLVSTTEASSKCPQAVIKFLEERADQLAAKK